MKTINNITGILATASLLMICTIGFSQSNSRSSRRITDDSRRNTENTQTRVNNSDSNTRGEYKQEPNYQGSRQNQQQSYSNNNHNNRDNYKNDRNDRNDRNEHYDRNDYGNNNHGNHNYQNNKHGKRYDNHPKYSHHDYSNHHGVNRTVYYDRLPSQRVNRFYHNGCEYYHVNNHFYNYHPSYGYRMVNSPYVYVDFIPSYSIVKIINGERYYCSNGYVYIPFESGFVMIPEPERPHVSFNIVLH